MSSNSLAMNNFVQNSLEQISKDNIRITHSTDTEPEADVERNFKALAEQLKKQYENSQDQRQKKSRNEFKRFIDKLPTYEYDIPKNRNNQNNSNLVPLNVRDSNNNRFCSYREAFYFIAKHCQNYDIKYTRENCYNYLKKCYIIDFAHDEFIPLTTHLSQKEFNRYFTLSKRELKYM